MTYSYIVLFSKGQFVFYASWIPLFLMTLTIRLIRDLQQVPTTLLQGSESFWVASSNALRGFSSKEGIFCASISSSYSLHSLTCVC